MPNRNRLNQRSWTQFKWLSLLSALMLLVIGGIGVTLHQRATAKFNQSVAVGGAADLVRDYLKFALDAETGQRGYVLTGQESYLLPYREAVSKLEAVRKQIPPTLSTPDMRAHYQRMDNVLRNKLVEMDMSISLYQESGYEKASEFIRADLGKALMDLVRTENNQLTAALVQTERGLIEQMLALRAQRDLFMLIALLIGFGSGLSAYFVIREHVIALRDEQASRISAERAIRESREKSVFLANMSHEIRTPMNAIFGFTQLLGDLVQGEREKHYVRAIRQSGDSLLTLINDILDLSKIESGRIELKPEPTDVAELMDNAAFVFSQQATSKALRLSTRADYHNALMVDALRVRQVIFNLIGNAIKYTDQGMVDARLTVHEQAQSASMTLQVTDSGLGIAQSDQARIFEPFTQVELSDRDARGGSGLGLSIVRRLMDAMGGSIQVESTPGKGSTFTARWPSLPLAGKSVARDVPSSGQLNDLAPLTIVGVDDVALNRELLEAIFADTHHQIDCADGGESGLKLIVEKRPKLVLMDIRMPGMDGRQALEHIRADPRLRAIRVVAVTASSLLGEETELRQLFDGYVRKPITREALLSELKRLFASNGSAALQAIEASQPALALATLSEAQRTRLLEEIAELTTRVATARSTFSTAAMAALEKQLCANAPLSGWLSAHAARLRAAREVFDLGAMEVALEGVNARLQTLQHDLATQGEPNG